MMNEVYKQLQIRIEDFKEMGFTSASDCSLYDDIERAIKDRVNTDYYHRRKGLRELFQSIDKKLQNDEYDLPLELVKYLQLYTYRIMQAKHSFIIPFLVNPIEQGDVQLMNSGIMERMTDVLFDTIMFEPQEQNDILHDFQTWFKKNQISISNVIGSSAYDDWRHLILLLRGKISQAAVSSLLKNNTTGDPSGLLWGVYVETSPALVDVDLAYKEGGINGVTRLIEALNDTKRYSFLDIVIKKSGEYEGKHPCIVTLRHDIKKQLNDKRMFYNIQWEIDSCSEDEIIYICKKMESDYLYFTISTNGHKENDRVSQLMAGEVSFISGDKFRESGDDADDTAECAQYFKKNSKSEDDKGLIHSTFLRCMSWSKDGAMNRSKQKNEIRAVIRVDIATFLRSFCARLRDTSNSIIDTTCSYYSEYVEGDYKTQRLSDLDIPIFNVSFGPVEYIESKSSMSPDILVKDISYRDDREVRLTLSITVLSKRTMRPHSVHVDNKLLSIKISNAKNCFKRIGYTSAGCCFNNIGEAYAHQKSISTSENNKSKREKC